MPSIYFAHPVTDYGTEREAAAIEVLRRAFPGWEIVNPNRADWADAYKRHGMQFFIERCGECDAGAFMPFPNGKIGAGVAKEMRSIAERRRPTYWVSSAGVTLADISDGDGVLSVDETRSLIAELRASAIEARSDETPQEARPEGRERDPKGDAHD